MRSNAAARSASSAHSRLQVFPRAVTKTACIASWQERPGRNPYDRDSNRASHSGSSAPAVRACNALSAITGIPSPRRFPPALGMKTRLTGQGLHAAAPCWSQEAISIFSLAPGTILPSTPAVLRPALTSVTRRTLNNAFARERSISFCRLRTFFRSPALLAVKIRCRSRRTSSPACRQSTASQSRTSSSGPFTMMVSNLPIGSGVSVHLVVTGSPDPRQLPFGPGNRPYPASYAETIRRRCQSCGPGFLLPFGYRHSLLGSSCARWGIEPSSRPAYRPPPVTGPQRGCRVAHEQAATGQGALFIPGTVVRSRPAITFRPAPAALPRPVPTAPLEHPIGRGHFHETSARVHAIHPSPQARLATGPRPGTPLTGSRRSSPRLRPPDGTRAASASAPGFAPRGYPRRTPERRRAITHWPGYYTPGLSRASNDASHLNSCTLTSHVIAARLHHHRGHLPDPQPVRQRQHLPPGGAEAAGLGHPPRRVLLRRHPDRRHHPGLADVDAAHPGPGTAARQSPLPRASLHLPGPRAASLRYRYRPGNRGQAEETSPRARTQQSTAPK
jgi:hypothetical protein